MKLKKNIRSCGILVLSVVLSLAIGCASAFADEEDISVQVTVGEHGSVNGHTSDFAENIESGNSLSLEIEADNGYVIGAVLVNEEELPDDDTKSITGKMKGTVDLEELEEDVTVSIEFEEDPAVTEGSEDSQASGNADPADTDESGTGDDTGSGADPAGEDGSEQEQDAEIGSDEEANPSDESADEGTDGATGDETSAPEESGDKQASDTGKDAGKAGAVSANAEQAHSTGSPKTGDEFPLSVILLMLSSIAGGAGVIGRRFWKMHLSQ